MARANSTFALSEEPPNKRVRVGAHELEVRIIILLEVCNSLGF
jgi:hypothetical protein